MQHLPVLRRRQLLQWAAAGSAVIAAPVVSAQALTPIRFTLDFRISGQVAPFFLAQYKGYYKAEGLDVNFDVGNGSVAAITRVASGAYDMGFGDVSALVEFAASQNGVSPVQAVYQYYNRAPFAIIGRKDRGIGADFKSLTGKRIAAAAVESTRRAWPMAARHAGMAVDSFDWITTDFSQRDNVIIRGDVDGATYFHDSALSLFERIDPSKLSVLAFADAGLDIYGNAILASSALIKAKPDAVKGFLRATNRAILECMANPGAAMGYVKQREAMIVEKTETERFGITARYIAMPDTKVHGIGDVKKSLVEQQIAEVSRTFALKTTPTMDAIYNLSFLPPLDQRMVRT